jgi:hypothetical protein
VLWLPERIFDDCCELCQFVDDAKAEVDPCTKMTRGCKDDTALHARLPALQSRPRLHGSKEASECTEEAKERTKGRGTGCAHPRALSDFMDSEGAMMTLYQLWKF